MSLVCPVCVCVFYVCVNMCVCALCVFGVSFKVWSFSPPPTSVTETRDPERQRALSGRWADALLAGPSRGRWAWVGAQWACTLLGSGDRDWGVVKGVVEELGLGGRPGVSCSRPATASTCARLSKGRVSLGCRGTRLAGRARGALFYSFLGVSRSLAGRATLPRRTCPACPVCSLTLLSPHSSLHLCPLSAFSPTLPVPRPAHHPARYGFLCAHTPDTLTHTARDTHTCVFGFTEAQLAVVV